MPVKKWMIQYTLAFPVLCALLAGVQYLKGQDLQYSLTFGLFWSVLSLATFAARRVYLYQKNIPCGVCNDLPQAEKEHRD